MNSNFYVDLTNDVRIGDKNGEIVCWTQDEWENEPEIVSSICNAIKIVYEQGPNELRKLIQRPLIDIEVHLHADVAANHGAGCDCGLCDMNGMSVGVGIFDASETKSFFMSDPLERIYGPSTIAARLEAVAICSGYGWRITTKGHDERL